jgi:hypothetical protein
LAFFALSGLHPIAPIHLGDEVLLKENLVMKTFIGLFSLIALLTTAGCVVGPAPAGVSVGVYGEYPYTYYGYGGYHHYYRPYYYHRYPYWYRGGYHRY